MFRSTKHAVQAGGTCSSAGASVNMSELNGVRGQLQKALCRVLKQILLCVKNTLKSVAAFTSLLQKDLKNWSMVQLVREEQA